MGWRGAETGEARGLIGKREQIDQAKEIQAAGENAFYDNVKAIVSDRDVTELVDLSRGTAMWSDEVVTTLETNREFYTNQTFGALDRGGFFRRERERKNFWDDYEQSLQVQSEFAIAEGLRKSLETLIFSGRQITPHLEAIRNLPFGNPVVVQALLDKTREDALLAYASQDDMKGIATASVCKRYAGVYSNLSQKTGVAIQDSLQKELLTPQKYKLVSLHDYHEVFKKMDPALAAAAEKLAREGFRGANGQPYELTTNRQFARSEKIVIGGASRVASEVVQGATRLKETLSDGNNAKRTVAAISLTALAGTGIAANAAANVQPDAKHSSSSASSIELSTLFSVTPGLARTAEAPKNADLSADLFSASPGKPAEVDAAVQQAQRNKVESALAGAFAVDPASVKAAEQKPSANPTDKKAVIQEKINRTIAESGVHAAAALLAEETPETAAPAAKNEELSRILNEKAALQLETIKQSQTLSEKAAQTDQQYVAYIMAASENPAILDQMTAEQKKTIIEAASTVAPDAVIALAKQKWIELDTIEAGKWAGYSKEQQMLIATMMASIDVSMMSQKDIVALLPKEVEEPEVKKAPEAPKIGKQIADAFAETTNRLTKSGSKWRNRAIAINFFRNEGYSLPQATALVGNFVVETGSEVMNPGTHQNGGPAQGMAQWEGGRLQRLFVFAENRGKQWNDLQTQLDFVIAELNGGESAAKAKIKQADTIEEATAAVMLYYERPYDAIHRDDNPAAYRSNLNKRIKAAKNAHTGYTSVLAKVKAEQKAAAEARAKAEAEAKAKAAAAAKAKADAEAKASQERRGHNKIIETPISEYGYGLPVSASDWANHNISFEYGREYYWRKGETYHTGTDLAVPTGTELFSLKRGKVTYAQEQNNTGIKTVVIEFFDGTFANYQHMSRYDVKVGDVVEQGELIGLSGNSGAEQGYSTFPHLHLTIGTTKKDPDGLVTSSDPNMRAKTDDPEALLYSQAETKRWLAKRH